MRKYAEIWESLRKHEKVEKVKKVVKVLEK